MVYLYFLRGGFWREDGSSVGKLTQLQFDLMTGRGQAYIRRTHFLAWSYDDAHVRRYMTQFGFADRARDESWYRSAERYQDAVCFTNDVSEYVKTEWVNARQERLRLLY